MMHTTEHRTTTVTMLALGLLLAALVAACLMLIVAAPLAKPSLAAMTFAVDRQDDPDPATAKACTDTPNDCSLRGAIVAANAATGADAVTVPAGSYILTRAGADEDATSTGDLDVTGELTITGAGADTTSVVGGAAPFKDRIFDNRPGAKTTISGLTITGGKIDFYDGGGVRNYQGDLKLDGVVVEDNTAGTGGGIDSREGDLTLDRVAVKGNTASNANGGVYSETGTLNITDSTVSGNTAGSIGGFSSYLGTLNLTHSTVSGNSATGSVGGVAQIGATANITNTTISGNKAAQYSGGFAAEADAVVNIWNSTIASNESERLGGGILTTTGATVLVKNTIVSGNTEDNCNEVQFGGDISSKGNNLSSDDSCNFTEPTDKQNTDPKLGPLQNNGGPTDTRALLAGSPAIDAGTNTGCPTTDQRGVARPQGLRCDIGAFERRNSPPAARDDAYDGVEDRTITRAAPGVLGNDTDPDGDALRAARVSGPGKGTLDLNRNGSFTYKPPSNFNGVVRFVYRASDGRGGSDTATVTLRIEARPG